jgi:hypothetical protein
MIGRTLEDLGFTESKVPHYVAVKESVFPLAKFHGLDTLLSPEMKSTAAVLERNKIASKVVKQVSKGHPNVGELIGRKEFSLIINTPLGKMSKDDDGVIRKAALLAQIP